MQRDMMDDGKVVSMSAFLNNGRYPLMAEVEAYWNALRGTQKVPARSDLDPRGIERALEYAFILERIGQGIGRLRIAGSHLSDVMGMEVRGMPISALIVPEARNMMASALEQVFAGPVIAELTLKSEKFIGKPEVEAKMLLLPMADDMGDATRALGVLLTRGQLGRTPRRFSLTQTEFRPIGRMIAPRRDTLTHGFAEDRVEFDAPRVGDDPRGGVSFVRAPKACQAEGDARVSHLKLVYSDD